MARSLRIEYPGAVYHITSRGNARKKIYRDEADREDFLATLSWVVTRFGWVCHAYCLMDNHYHLLIETPQANLSLGMRQLNGVYTQHHNRRHRQVGHLFQGRFKAILVERDRYFLELARYIVLNPVRAKMVKSVEQHPWSSYRATIATAPANGGLTVSWLLGQFAKTLPVARRRYAAFVHAGMGSDSPWRALKGQILLGGDAFVARMTPHLQAKADIPEIPKRQRLLHRLGLPRLLHATKSKADRNEAMTRAHLQYGYTQAAIAKALGLHYATVSRIIRATEEKSNSKM